MIRPGLAGKRQVSAEERRAQLGNQLLGRASLAAEPAFQVAGTAGGMPGQVRRLIWI